MPSSTAPVRTELTAATALRCVVVDDEDLARQRIVDLLEAEPRIRVIGTCSHGAEAVETIPRLEPDLVFLDVQMPDLDGFGVIDSIGREQMPPVIFVTAFDHYALRAFETAAVDYLLKPFDRERFQRAVDRALERFRRVKVEELTRAVDDLRGLGLVEPEGHHTDRLVVRQGGTVHLIKIEDIDWVEAARNYVRIHCGAEVHTMRETMTKIEERLDPERFVRIHRSTLVNVDRIRRIEPGYGSESRLELEDGTKLMISRAYRRGQVRRLLEDFD
ncbi:MAG: LytTR family DNA-binding domain-containing protein [Acidobacteriota bacterium]